MVRTVGSDRRAVRFKEQYTGNGRYAGTKDRRTWQPVRGTAAPQRIASGKGGEPETAPQGARRPSMSLRTVLFMLFIIAAMTGLLLYYIKLQADVTRTSREIADLEQKLTQMQAENDADYNEINDSINLEEVRDRAIHELGMKYADRDQVIIYSGSEKDTVHQVTETEGD